MGCPKCRPGFVARLREELGKAAPAMCADCRRRVETNPLRVLDCKIPEDQPIIEALPSILDHLCAECRAHFDAVRQSLADRGIAFEVRPRLVRGLDYYMRTTFEVVHGALGAQNSVLGGGRYDGLAESAGLEGPRAGHRLLDRRGPPGHEPRREPRRGIQAGTRPFDRAAGRAARCGTRRCWPATCAASACRVEIAAEARLKRALELANKLAARYALIVGEDEIAAGNVHTKEHGDWRAGKRDTRRASSEVGPWLTADGVPLDFLGELRRTHTCGQLRASDAGSRALLMGWVHRRRDLGGVIFIHLRDRDGVTQLVFHEDQDPRPCTSKAELLRPEYVIAVEGRVASRTPETVNPAIATGEVEVVAEKLWILNESRTPPFPMEETVDVSEEMRLKYRYVDLRRPHMQRNIMLRSKISFAVREFLYSQGFLEIETPFMTRSTPEGARDYLVPSRVQPGSFYALPQSPQIFKQLLMISGFDKYFQIVRCFRDEDFRADRQAEFTQIDLEMSFPQQERILRGDRAAGPGDLPRRRATMSGSVPAPDLRAGDALLRHRQAGPAPAAVPHGRGPVPRSRA